MDFRISQRSRRMFSRSNYVSTRVTVLVRRVYPRIVSDVTVWNPASCKNPLEYQVTPATTFLKNPPMVLREHRLVQHLAQAYVQCSPSKFFVRTSFFKIFRDYFEQICKSLDVSCVTWAEGFPFSSSSNCNAIFHRSPPNLRSSRAISSSYAAAECPKDFTTLGASPDKWCLSWSNLYLDVAGASWTHAKNAAVKS